jgi:endonuclease/exonuclease/phosphatase family metal-dependent hydrolase
MDSGLPMNRSCLLLLLLFLAFPFVIQADLFRVATYNVEGYLDTPVPGRLSKSAEAKAKVRESIRALKPDVLALQEMGSLSALLELRDSLNGEGLAFPYWEHVAGFDTNIHVAILSRFPFIARRPHTNENFLLSGRRFRVSRGFAEVDVQVSTNYSFTLIAAHLKSKRATARADETEMRLEEAKQLREIVDERLVGSPTANLVVLGDFNDNKDSQSTKAIIGRGKLKLVDTRPAERNSDHAVGADSSTDSRDVTWTHYYAKEDAYNRIDYILLSPGMAHEWVQSKSYVLTLPGWGTASDHRPIVAAFETDDK